MTEPEWISSEDPSAMLALLTGAPGETGRSGMEAEPPQPPAFPVSDRKLRLFACACCRQVWHLLTDGRSRRAVEAAERHADGGEMGEEYHRSWSDSWDAKQEYYRSWSDSWDAKQPREASAVIPWLFGRTDAPGGIAGQVWHLLRDRLVAGSVGAAILRDVAGNPWRPVRCRQTLNPLGSDTVRWKSVGELEGCDCAWLTPTVLSLARGAYDERQADGTLDPARLAVLSDALEEAGCSAVGCIHCGGGAYIGMDPPCGCAHSELLLHLRSPGPHVRGCWAVDLILGKG